MRTLYRVSILDHILAVPAWPLALLALGLLLAVLTATASVGLALRHRVRGARVALGAAAAAFVLATVFLFGPPVVGAFFGAQVDCEGCGPSFLVVMRLPLAVSAGLALALALLASVGAGAAATLPHQRVTTGPVLLATMVFAVLLALPAVGGATVAGLAGPTPTLEVEPEVWVHVGGSRPMTPRVVADPGGWRVLNPPALDTATPGRQEVEVGVGRLGLRVHRAVGVVVDEELADPRMPLRVGNRWSFVPYQRSGPAPRTLLWGGGRTVTHGEQPATLEVVGAHDALGLRRFTLRWLMPAGEPQHLEAVAFGGRTVLLGPEGPVPLLQLRTEPDPRFGLARARCDFALTPELRCACAVRPGGPAAQPPGPLDCWAPTGSGDPGRILVLVASLGLFDPGSERGRQGLELVDFAQGHEGAAGAPPSWHGYRSPSLQRALEALEEERFDDRRLEALAPLAPSLDLGCEELAVLLGEGLSFSAGRATALGMLRHTLPDQACESALRQAFLPLEEFEGER